MFPVHSGGDAVELHPQPGTGTGRLQPLQHLVQGIPPGYDPILRPVQGVQTEIDAIQPGAQQGRQLLLQQHAIGGQPHPLDAGSLLQPGDQPLQIFAHQWLPAGEPDPPCPQPGEEAGQAQQLLIAEHIAVSQCGDALRRHTVGTAQIAPVGDGQPQIGDVPVPPVCHGVSSWENTPDFPPSL